MTLIKLSFYQKSARADSSRNTQRTRFIYHLLWLPVFPFISYLNARKKGQFLHFPIENRRKRGKNRPVLLDVSWDRVRAPNPTRAVPTRRNVHVINWPKTGANWRIWIAHVCQKSRHQIMSSCHVRCSNSTGTTSEPVLLDCSLRWLRSDRFFLHFLFKCTKKGAISAFSYWQSQKKRENRPADIRLPAPRTLCHKWNHKQG